MKHAAAKSSPPEVSLEELKEEFLCNVSHEFRSPMAAIMGYLDLVMRQEETLTPKQKEYLGEMKRSATRLCRFVDNLMMFTKLESGLLDPKTESVAVKDVLVKSVEAAAKPLSACQLTAVIDCPDTLGATADTQLLRHLIDQLISNAILFTPDGGQISLWARAEDGPTILLGVTDTGVGIPHEQWQSVFAKFEQVRQTKNQARKTIGTGLGLAIAKRLVEAQKGKIWIQSSSPKGTTVVWTLPKSHPVHILLPSATTTSADARQRLDGGRRS